MATFIAQITSGDTPQDSIQFKSLFAVALVLFVMTLVLNLISNRVVARYPEQVLMSAATTPCRGRAARGSTRSVARRRLTGTIFLGACIAAIGILLHRPVALLVDVVTKGVPVARHRLPDRASRRAVPSRPASCRPWSARSRSA